MKRPSHHRMLRRLAPRAAVVAAAVVLASCSGDPIGPGGPGGPGDPGGADGTAWPAPYGEEIASADVPFLCNVGIHDITDTYVRGPGPDVVPEAVRSSVAEPGAAPARATSSVAAVVPPWQSLIPSDDGVIDRVSVEVVRPPTSPVVELEITLTGPDRPDPYLADSAMVSFLSVEDHQRWVGFVLVDGAPARGVPFPEAIAASPGGTTTTIEVVPLACPDNGTTDNAQDGEAFAAQPLSDGRYELSIYGSAEPESPPEGSPYAHAMWGQERTLVDVRDGIISGIGYDGANAYG